MDFNQPMPARNDFVGRDTVQPNRDPLLRAIIGTALGLVLLTGIAAFWGSGSVLVAAPWYIPLISSFIALTTLSVAYLALGRYQVMRDTFSYWVGSGFAIYGMGQIFYALTWSGLLAGGQSVLGHLANTTIWISLVDLTLLDVFLLAAILLRWPDVQSLAGMRWLWSLIAWLLLAMVAFSLLIAAESHVPALMDVNGEYTRPMQIWLGIQMLVFATGSILSIYYYRRSKDKLAAFISFPQMALVFSCMMVLIGGKRYDLWWYLQRFIVVSAHLTVLFGLLSEYIRLLRRESEGWRMLEAILENVPLGLAVTDGPPDFPINLISRNGLEMNQRSVYQFIGSSSEENQPLWKILLPDGVTQLSPEQLPIYQASRSGEQIRNMELLMERLDGHNLSLLVNAAPIRDMQGNIVSAISTWLDITERKRAEESREETEALYRAIARSIPNGGIFIVDKNLRYLIAEGAILESFGYSREMLEGNRVADIFNADTSARMDARFRRVFAGETISHETEHKGRIYWTQYALLQDPLEHAIVITLDITERKQAEQALSESEQRFRAIVNQATAGIVRTAPDGKVVFVNQAFCKMLGLKESDLIGKTILPFTYQDDIEEDNRLYNRLMEKGIPFQLEKRLIRKDGSTLWVSVSAAPILDAVGRPQSAVSIIVDISKRKQAENDLQQLNVQLESRVQERTAELQNANVDLLESRRRLQVLSQRLVEVQEQERRALARELHDRVGQSLIALNLNLTIINNQLTDKLTSPVSSRLADSIKLATEIIAIVRNVMSDLRPVVLDEYGMVAALQAHIEKFENRYGLNVEFTSSEPPVPRVNAAMEITVLRIAQEALLNIARHAQANHISLSLQWEKDAMLLTVQDNGIGIPASNEGSYPNGHGLMIMRERAEAVGGSLNILSTIDKGTRIEASLPFQQNGSIPGNTESD